MLGMEAQPSQNKVQPGKIRASEPEDMPGQEQQGIKSRPARGQAGQNLGGS
jgi:hypothetical protein